MSSVQPAILQCQQIISAADRKGEISDSLQQLTSRAKNAQVHITKLKNFQDKVNAHCEYLSAELERQCDELLSCIVRARTRLKSQLMREKDISAKTYRDQTSACTRRLHQTTSLVQFCIEAIKEPDPVAFMQIGPQLIGRVSDLDHAWDKTLSTSPTSCLSPYIDLDLDHKSAVKSINSFNFIKMNPPGAPEFIIEECCGESESVTASWNPHPMSKVTNYALEIEEGDGVFKEVHRGLETLCTIEGLKFNQIYQLRVRAFNISGMSPYSPPIAVRTSPAGWFCLDRTLSHAESKISLDGMTVTSENYEHRVAMATVNYSRDRHYWQFRVESYDANADIVVGVACHRVNKNIMLGKDEYGWAMYIDHQRSWFLHDAAHHGRCSGGIKVGSRIGVLLDLERRCLEFFVNDTKQGETAFSDLEGSFYPAVSVNRNVTISLQPCITPTHELTNHLPVNIEITNNISDSIERSGVNHMPNIEMINHTPLNMELLTNHMPVNMELINHMPVNTELTNHIPVNIELTNQIDSCIDPAINNQTHSDYDSQSDT